MLYMLNKLFDFAKKKKGKLFEQFIRQYVYFDITSTVAFTLGIYTYPSNLRMDRCVALR